MIEFAFDDNIGNTFLGDETPVFEIPSQVFDNFDVYKSVAANLLRKHQSDKYVTISDKRVEYSRNLFAVALFVESYKQDTKIDCVIFKSQNHTEEVNNYKPYIALIIGLKYVFSLIDKAPNVIYKDISLLGYLGLEINEDYANNQLNIKYNNASKIQNVVAEDVDNALIIIGALKSLSLARAQVGFDVVMPITNTKVTKSIDELTDAILKIVLPILKKQS